MTAADLVRPAWRELGLTVAAAAGLFAVGAGAVPLLPDDEPRFAQAAREMLARGDAVVPTFGGAPRYDKPILLYWLLEASYVTFGATERAARLPSTVAGTLTVLLVAWWARSRWGAGAGLTAGLMLAVTPVFFVEAKACTADAVLLLPTTAAMLALQRIVTRGSHRGAQAAFWLGMGFSILAKGPVGPAVTVTTAVAAWGVSRRWRRWELWALAALVMVGWWRLGPTVLLAVAAYALWESVTPNERPTAWGRLGWPWGVPLLIAITLPWVLAAWQATGGAFFRESLARHVVARAMTPLESHGGIPGFYLLTSVVVAFPWLPLLPSALRGRLRSLGENAELRFLVVWLLGPLVLVELTHTKLVHYWLPAYPAGVLLVTGWLCGRRVDGSRPLMAGATRLLGTVGGVALAIVPVALAVRLTVAELAFPAVIVAISMIAAVSVLLGCPAERPRRAVGALAAGAGLYLVAFVLLIVKPVAGHTLGRLAAMAAVAERLPGEPLVVYQVRDPDVMFYLPLDAAVCRTRECLDDFAGRHPSFLGVARAGDVETLMRARALRGPATVRTVEGLDVARGRWERVMLFRPGSWRNQ